METLLKIATAAAENYMRKQANASIKKHWAYLNPKSQERLLSAGNVDWDKETAGIVRGNERLIQQHRITVEKSTKPGVMFASSMPKVFAGQGDPIVDRIIGVRPSKMLLPEWGMHPNLTGSEHARLDAEFMRHEIDEHMAVDKYMLGGKRRRGMKIDADRHHLDSARDIVYPKKNKAITIDRSVLGIASHAHPDVVIRENNRMSFAPKRVQEVERSIRASNNKAVGNVWSNLAHKFYGPQRSLRMLTEEQTFKRLLPGFVYGTPINSQEAKHIAKNYTKSSPSMFSGVRSAPLPATSIPKIPYRLSRIAKGALGRAMITAGIVGPMVAPSIAASVASAFRKPNEVAQDSK